MQLHKLLVQVLQLLQCLLQALRPQLLHHQQAQGQLPWQHLVQMSALGRLRRDSLWPQCQHLQRMASEMGSSLLLLPLLLLILAMGQQLLGFLLHLEATHLHSLQVFPQTMALLPQVKPRHTMLSHRGQLIKLTL